MCKHSNPAIKERWLIVIRKGSRPVFLVLVSLLVVFFCLPGHLQAPPDRNHDILRFHVRAHSNRPGDQRIKNFVAQKVLTHFQPEWSRCRSSDELRSFLVENSTALEDVTRKTLQACGSSHDVQVFLTREMFPARCYEGRLYPPGEYAALYLIIGEGRGENWWCVLFPPLCFSAAPFLLEDDEELHPVSNRQAKKYGNVVTQVAAAEEGKEIFRREKPSCRWRFWLWDFLRRKGAAQNIETARSGPVSE